jgi:hypothetical protein
MGNFPIASRWLVRGAYLRHVSKTGGDTPPRERELEPNTNYTVSDYQLDFRNRKVKF